MFRPLSGFPGQYAQSEEAIPFSTPKEILQTMHFLSR
jgi:hypothetical protein